MNEVIRWRVEEWTPTGRAVPTEVRLVLAHIGDGDFATSDSDARSRVDACSR
jgi:hypothetical protein